MVLAFTFWVISVFLYSDILHGFTSRGLFTYHARPLESSRMFLSLRIRDSLQYSCPRALWVGTMSVYLPMKYNAILKLWFRINRYVTFRAPYMRIFPSINTRNHQSAWLRALSRLLGYKTLNFRYEDLDLISLFCSQFYSVLKILVKINTEHISRLMWYTYSLFTRSMFSFVIVGYEGKEEPRQFKKESNEE